MSEEEILNHQTDREEESVCSNLERLRSHLKTDGLARALLDAWTTGDRQGGTARMREIVEQRFAIKKSDDDAAD
jgi:hypothetical protein